MKFRKKPVIIEAVKFGLAEYSENPFVAFDDMPDWLVSAFESKKIRPVFKTEDYWYIEIETLNGVVLAGPGTMVMLGVKGELYPCEVDIFNETHEPADAPTRDAKFIAHIQAHLPEGEEVVCKICGKTAKEIIAES